MLSNTTGIFNVGIGVNALRVNYIWYCNVAVGDRALYANTLGIGHFALQQV